MVADNSGRRWRHSARASDILGGQSAFTLSFKPARILVSPPKGYYLEAGGIRQSFALSPDGERIAFTAKDASGGFRVFLRDFSEPESRPLADDEGGYSVVWSPDGDRCYSLPKASCAVLASTRP
jgi:hypothetical protein